MNRGGRGGCIVQMVQHDPNCAGTLEAIGETTYHGYSLTAKRDLRLCLVCGYDEDGPRRDEILLDDRDREMVRILQRGERARREQIIAAARAKGGE